MLRDVQQSMADLLLAGDREGGRAGDLSAARLFRSGKLTAARRLEVYRHNVLTNLRGALMDIFPVVQRIVGDAFFQHAADRFIRSTPSQSGDLNQFGREWPAFLADYPHATELPYLADVARLEWAWHECFHAEDAAPLDFGRLAAIDPEEQGALFFGLHPAVRLLASAFPVMRIWQVNQTDYAGDRKIDWESRGDTLLVRREDGVSVEVVIQSLSAGAWRFLRELQLRRALEPATVAALEEDAEFDLQEFLVEFVQSGVIIDFSREEAR